MRFIIEHKIKSRKSIVLHCQVEFMRCVIYFDRKQANYSRTPGFHIPQAATGPKLLKPLKAVKQTKHLNLTEWLSTI